MKENRRQKVLFVDDEPGVRRTVGRLLDEMGYQVTTASGGEEALELMGLETAEIVITDVRMPGVDGVALLQALKRWWPMTEVIILSGHGDFNMAVTCLKHGASDFLPKPVDDESLEVAIRRAEERIESRLQSIRYQEAMEAELKRLRVLYGRVFDASPSSITVLDEDFTIIEANRTCETLFGKAAGKKCFEVMRKREGPCPGCPMEKTLQDGQVHTREMVVSTREGDTRNMVSMTAPLFDSEGTITGVVETTVDMTTLRALEDRLRSVGMMAGSVSHGIKGLLTRLDAGAYALEQGLDSQDFGQVKSGWETVRRSTDAMAELSLRMLSMTRPKDVVRESVEISWLVNEAVEAVSPLARREDVALLEASKLPDYQLRVDVAAMRSAITAVFENGVDACKGLASQNLSLTYDVSMDEKWITLTLEDTGCGIKPEDLEKLFTPFFSTKGSDGTGLGLFLARQVVEEHNGSLGISSQWEKGSKVTLKLPV